MYYDFLLCFDIVSADRRTLWKSSWSLSTSAHVGGKQVDLFFSPAHASCFHLPGLGLLWWCGEFRHLGALSSRVGLTPATPLPHLLRCAWVCLGTDGLMRHLEGPVSWGVVEEGGRAVVVRDHMGRVPVSYATHQGSWAISSHPLAPTMALDLPRQPRPTVARALCEGQAPLGADDDLFEHTTRLLPHHALFVSRDGGGHVEPTWDPALSALPPSSALVHDYLERLGAAAPVTAPPGRATLMLSAGLDSVTLGALFGDCLEGAASMVFPPWPGADESPWLDAIKDAIALPLVRLDMSQTWALRDPQMLTCAPDLGPLVHPGNTYEHEFLCHIKALNTQGTRFVSGLGADELLQASLLPYLRHLGRHDPSYLSLFLPLLGQAQRRALWKHGVAAGIFGPRGLGTLRALRHRALRGRLHPQVATLPPFAPGRWMTPTVGVGTRKQAFKEQALLEQGEFGAWRLGQMHQWPWELTMRGIRRQERLLGDQMIYPYLDKALWEFALRLPPQALWGVRAGRVLGKTIARDAALLIPDFPHHLVDRPKTTTFAAPVDYGLAIKEVDVLRALSLAPRLREWGLVRPKALRERTEHYVQTVQRSFPTPHHLAATPLWRTLAVEHWLSLLL